MFLISCGVCDLEYWQPSGCRFTHHSNIEADSSKGCLLCTTEKSSLEQRTHELGASTKMGAIFLEKNNILEQRTHKLGASRNMGAIFLRKNKFGLLGIQAEKNKVFERLG